MPLALAVQNAEYYNQTTLHPMGLAAFAVCALILLAVPRRHALLPLFLMAAFVVPAQRIVIGGLDFSLMRLMVLVGWGRLAMRGEYAKLRLRTLDKLIIAWVVSSATAYILLRGSSSAVTNRLGRSYDFIGMYVYIRCVLRDWSDLDRLIKSISLLSLPVMVFFLIEKSTGRNLFSVFGGIPSMTPIREGRLRCQGAFPHPILAGTFWAGLLPLVAAQWWTRPRSRALTVCATGAIFLIVFATSSSTPIGGVGASMMGAGLWMMRRHLRPLRWSVVATLCALHLVMKAPVWHLIARIDLAGGSTGWHRYLLIDQTIKRFNEWWLFGVLSSAHWGPNQRDTANQYVAEAVSGGFLTLVLFCFVMGIAFRDVGRLRRKMAVVSRPHEIRVWAIGVALFAHALMFIAISISYSPQNLLLVLTLFGSIASLSSIPLRRRAPMAQPVVAGRVALGRG